MFALVDRTLTGRRYLILFICCPAMNPKHVTVESVLDLPLGNSLTRLFYNSSLFSAT